MLLPLIFRIRYVRQNLNLYIFHINVHNNNHVNEKQKIRVDCVSIERFDLGDG